MTLKALNSWFDDCSSYPAGDTFETVIAKYGFKREEIIRLAGNESTIGSSPLAIKAAQKASTESNFYDEPYSESLVTDIESKFSTAGIDMSNSAVICSNGMDKMIEHVIGLFANSGDSILNINPTFTFYEFAAKRSGIECVNLARKQLQSTDANFDFEYHIDPEEIKNSIQANTKIVFLCSPNNPDGSVIGFDVIEDLCEFLASKNIILFVDHAYIHFCSSEYDVSKLVSKYSNLIVGYTFSKAYALAGYRVGFALINKELKNIFLTMLTPFLCAKPSIAAAIASMNDVEHTKKIILNNMQQLPKVNASLREMGFKTFKSQANFITFYDEAKEASEIYESLLAKGIIIRKIAQVSSKALRVTIGSESENQKFIDSLKECLVSKI